MLDHTGAVRTLSEFWSERPALLMFWRHFGCGCGFDRAARLNEEYDAYRAVGLRPVILALGEPEPGRGVPPRARSPLPRAVRP